MRTLRFASSLICAAVLTVQAFAWPAAGKYLRAADVDVTAMIPPAPADNSLTTAADLMTVLAVQARRTPESVALATYFAEQSVFQFDAVIGPWFNAKSLPRTAAIFEQVAADRYAISSKGKAFWARPRPPLLDPRVHACIELPSSGAYPSGHTTMAYVWAGLLAEVFPEKREALQERAAMIGWSRIVGGVHYPSDVAAGRILGEKLAQEFLKVPALRAALDEVKAEVAHAAQSHAVAD